MIDKNQVIFVKGNGFACFETEESAHNLNSRISEDALLHAISAQINNAKNEKAFCSSSVCESFINFVFEGYKSIVDICQFILSFAKDIVLGEFAFILPDGRIMLINVDFGKLRIQYSGS